MFKPSEAYQFDWSDEDVEIAGKPMRVQDGVMRLLVTRRPRYGCRSCESTVVQAPAPARIVEGGIPTEALNAQVG